MGGGGDFGVKIKVNFLIFRGSFGAAKFLTRMLSLQRFFKFFDVLGTGTTDLYAHAEHTGQELLHTLSVRVRN